MGETEGMIAWYRRKFTVLLSADMLAFDNWPDTGRKPLLY
jgi:hypothetical protein